MKENMKSRRGVALAEAVIALVVIGIISVATLTIIFSSVQVENKTIVAMDVRNQAENAIECFRFAKGDKAKFIECLDMSVGVTKEEKDENNALGFQCEDNALYVLDKGGYSIKITLLTKKLENGKLVLVPLANDADSWDAFNFEAVYENSQSNDSIYEFKFPKSSTEGGTTE